MKIFKLATLFKKKNEKKDSQEIEAVKREYEKNCKGYRGFVPKSFHGR